MKPEDRFKEIHTLGARLESGVVALRKDFNNLLKTQHDLVRDKGLLRNEVTAGYNKIKVLRAQVSVGKSNLDIAERTHANNLRAVGKHVDEVKEASIIVALVSGFFTIISVGLVVFTQAWQYL